MYFKNKVLVCHSVVKLQVFSKRCFLEMECVVRVLMISLCVQAKPSDTASMSSHTLPTTLRTTLLSVPLKLSSNVSLSP
jgi:hypothetical protein